MAADASALDLRSVGCLTANRAVEKADAVAVMRKRGRINFMLKEKEALDQVWRERTRMRNNGN